MTQEEFDAMVATLEQENRQLRARNERLQTEAIDSAPRELSDEEIISIYHDQANRDFQLRFDALKFAKAILRKAQEK